MFAHSFATSAAATLYHIERASAARLKAMVVKHIFVLLLHYYCFEIEPSRPAPVARAVIIFCLGGIMGLKITQTKVHQPNDCTLRET